MPGVYERTAARMVSKTRIKHFEQIIPVAASCFFTGSSGLSAAVTTCLFGVTQEKL